ncbi:uncharacterized protein BCR38DRAFT_56799 [Pseudomassariella vexata]|uniref:Uncharacterized protein n=1 Tax=Pseudomassariella vexata TaxID=1141098 RepID=A0A1Y2DLU7_9PEZI|nr:uncharacterized protein BCR38DRAFT_56799 [Pseudomassariella vexata]ORY60253.1 hypothetical protein BCR38DRAFT_56799 [Pseudomassariella vexata]
MTCRDISRLSDCRLYTRESVRRHINWRMDHCKCWKLVVGQEYGMWPELHRAVGDSTRAGPVLVSVGAASKATANRPAYACFWGTKFFLKGFSSTSSSSPHSFFFTPSSLLRQFRGKAGEKLQGREKRFLISTSDLSGVVSRFGLVLAQIITAGSGCPGRQRKFRDVVSDEPDPPIIKIKISGVFNLDFQLRTTLAPLRDFSRTQDSLVRKQH